MPFLLPPHRPSRHASLRIALAIAMLFGSGLVAPASAADAVAAAAGAAPRADAATLARVRDAALGSDYAYGRLEDLTDLIGPRLSGSPGAAAAVTWVAAELRRLGARVTLQPVKVPHWVRGIETGEVVEYAGRPAGIAQKIVLTALGGSAATPPAGITAEVLVVHDLDELKARAAEVRGRIVLLDTPFDQQMADRGLAGAAYGQAVALRNNGPRAAAELGAAAALVRSVGGAAYRIVHTGVTDWGDGARIPAAAVTTEDALLIGRLARRGPVTLHLTLTPRTLPDADSHNVIADWPGTAKADEIVLVSGHLDSWDLAYLAANRRLVGKHVAAYEDDSGAGRPFGLHAGIGREAMAALAPLRAVLAAMGAGTLRREDVVDAGDLSGLEEVGVPSFEPWNDTSDYFDYHHTTADTFDKVNPDNLRRHVALMATTAWFLANTDAALGRSNVVKDAPATVP